MIITKYKGDYIHLTMCINIRKQDEENFNNNNNDDRINNGKK